MPLIRYSKPLQDPLASSKLFDEKTFYKAFINDLWSLGRESLLKVPLLQH